MTVPTSPATDPVEGWGMRGMKRKTHYYRDGTPLCGQGSRVMGARLFDRPDPWPCKKCAHIRDTETGQT